MIWQLALLNTRKRLSQSLLTFGAMLLAASTLIAGMSQAEGTVAGALPGYRSYYNADILVFTPGHIGANPALESLTELQHKVIRDSGFNPLLELYPEMLREGYIAPTSWLYRPISDRERALIEQHPNVVAVEPVLQLPAHVNGRAVLLKPAIVPGASILGRLPIGKYEAAVNAYGSIPCGIGDALEILVPAYGVDAVGLPYVDAVVASLPVDVAVTALVSRPTREITYMATGGYVEEQAYVHSPEIYLDETLWAELWEAQSDGHNYPALALRVRLENMGKLSSTAAELQKELPHLTVIPIDELAQHVERYTLLDWFYRIPQDLWLKTEQARTAYRAVDFGSVNKLLLYLVCGILMASQMLLRVAERRREVATLKAIGLSRFELIAVMMLEAWLISIAGAGVGAFLTSIITFVQHLSNGYTILWSLLTCLKEISLVLTFTTAAVVVFGALPTLISANQTVMEAYRR